MLFYIVGFQYLKLNIFHQSLMSRFVTKCPRRRKSRKNESQIYISVFGTLNNEAKQSITDVLPIGLSVRVQNMVLKIERLVTLQYDSRTRGGSYEKYSVSPAMFIFQNQDTGLVMISCTQR